MLTKALLKNQDFFNFPGDVLDTRDDGLHHGDIVRNQHIRCGQAFDGGIQVSKRFAGHRRDDLTRKAGCVGVFMYNQQPAGMLNTF